MTSPSSCDRFTPPFLTPSSPAARTYTEDPLSDGLLHSAICIPILSHAALASLTSLKPESECDKTLLEYRFALSLKRAGKLQAIFPITVGPKESLGSLGDGFGDYYATKPGSKLPRVLADVAECPQLSVSAVEAELRTHLASAGVSDAAHQGRAPAAEEASGRESAIQYV